MAIEYAGGVVRLRSIPLGGRRVAAIALGAKSCFVFVGFNINLILGNF